MHIQGEAAVRDSQRSEGQWGPVTAHCLPHSLSAAVAALYWDNRKSLGQMTGEERACIFQLFRPQQNTQLWFNIHSHTNT